MAETPLDHIRRVGVVPIFTTDDDDVAVRVVAALARGGATAIEFTNRTPRALDVFTGLRRTVASHHPEVVLGVGSIADDASAGAFIEAGADFVVSAFTSAAVARTCGRHDVPYIPGCGTVTEIAAAQQAGADVVKVFPADAIGGPGFVKAVLAPMPWTSIMATGGISTERKDLEAWFEAGVACVGLGSSLVSAESLDDPDTSELERRTRDVVDTVSAVRRDR